jgi:hypothetical protein
VSVNRVTVSATQCPDGHWVAHIQGWRDDHGVAWSKPLALPTDRPESVQWLLEDVSLALLVASSAAEIAASA